MTETNIYNFASFTKLINNSQVACRFLCEFSREKHRRQQRKCLREVCSVYRSLLHFSFKTADLNIFSFVGVNEGQAKTFLRQITGQQLWPAQINS